MKKVQLERILQSLAPLARPKAPSEQYATPAAIAAEVVYGAHGKGDIEGRSVIDLGCGNGVLAVASKLLGASRVIGVDSDPLAIEVAGRNSMRAKLDVDWRLADVEEIREPCDTVLMNPPFGAQTRHADRRFVDAALRIGRTVYTFLNAKAEDFVRGRIESARGRITDRLEYAFPIPHLFEFHREPVHLVEVLLYRIEGAKD